MAKIISVNMSPALLDALDRGVRKMAANKHPAARAAGGYWGRSSFVRLALETLLAGPLDCAPEPAPETPAPETPAPEPKPAKDDPWAADVAGWLAVHPFTEGFTAHDVAAGCKMPVEGTDGHVASMRIGAILRGLGYTKERRMIKGARLWRWYRRN